MGIQQVLTDVRLAFLFLTTLPVASPTSITATAIGRSVRYFPLVGFAVGGILGVIGHLLRPFLPAAMLSVVLVVVLLGLTGMLHFDGFLDSCDGLYAPRSPEQRLEIMQDSRVGSFAVAGGWALLTLKATALYSLDPTAWAPGLLLGSGLGRWALVVAVVGFPYGRKDGSAAAYKEHTGWTTLGWITLGVLAVAYGLLSWRGVGLVFMILGVTLTLGRFIMTKLPQGLTGDSYGFITEISEMTTWLVLGIV